MTLRHALLGLLARGPRTGYEMLRSLRGPLAHVWTANHSQIYPELARMLADGVITEVGSGARGKRTYAITATGRQRLRTWLIESEPSRESRNESLLRIFFLGLVDRADSEAYLRREAGVHRSRLMAYESVMAEPPTDSDSAVMWSRAVLEWGVRYERSIAEWLEWLLDHRPAPDAEHAMAGERD